MIRISSALLLTVLVVGCSTEGIQTRFYTLNGPNIHQLKEERGVERPVLLIETISLSDYLRQQGIVVKNTEHRLSISNNHRWAESLENSLSRTVRMELEKRLTQYRIENQNTSWKTKPTLRLKIKVNRFELDNLKKQAVSFGRLWIFDENGELQSSFRYSIEEDLEEGGFEHAVAKLELTVGKLADIITANVESLNAL